MSVTRIKRRGVHNSSDAMGLKVRLREEALAYVGAERAEVLDLFAGPVGEMWSRVWSRASGYLGVDVEYRPWDVRRRLVCPWELAVQHLDLGRFTVLDLDAFGSPWGALSRTMERYRPTAKRIAVVTTDGSWRAVRTHNTATIDGDLRRMGVPRAARTFAGRGETSRAALTAFVAGTGYAMDTLRVFASGASRGAGAGSSSLVYSVCCATRSS